MLLVNSGCIGTIVVATIIIKKKRARARLALSEQSDKTVSCSCCGESYDTEYRDQPQVSDMQEDKKDPGGRSRLD